MSIFHNPTTSCRPKATRGYKRSWFWVVLVFLAFTHTTTVRADETVILGFGDSLMAGYGLTSDESFPVQLELYLKTKEGLNVRVVNAGVSGDTSSGGLSRLDWALTGLNGVTPDLVILELGANDALRGIPPDLTRKNLDRILEELKARGIPVLLAGMLAPPNMGGAYGAEFNSVYKDLSHKHKVGLYPFFLEGVALDSRLNQADGIHPTGEGVAVIVENIAPYVMRALAAPSP